MAENELQKLIRGIFSRIKEKYGYTDEQALIYLQGLQDCAEENQQSLEKRDKMLRDTVEELCEAKRLLQAAEKTIDDYCRGYCECCKNRDFELARCGLVNGCRDKDNWEWILSYRVKELIKED